MESTRSILVKTLLFGVFILLLRFVYVVTITGGSCSADDFCFFSSRENLNLAGAGVRIGSNAAVSVAGTVESSSPALRDLWTSKEWRKNVDYYSSIFQDLISEGFLSSESKALCIQSETRIGQDVFALKEIGVSDSIGTYKKASPPLVKFGQVYKQPFADNTFDFIFIGNAGLDRSIRQSDLVSEIQRTLKPEGFIVVHTNSTKDLYSYNSFISLFNYSSLIRTRTIDNSPDDSSSISSIQEIVLKKNSYQGDNEMGGISDGGSECSVPRHKQELVKYAEPLIEEEPLKPWITLKRNIQNVKYLPTLADINFKQRYVYVDVGARSYGSSIGSWFKKQYPKQNKTFDIYAIEADKTFQPEYKLKKGITLLPYAAWVKNETLLFEVNRDPGQNIEAKGSGMGRIKPVKSDTGLANNVNKIQGFDFADWLKNTVTEKDFVVMKMDIEGTEFDLIPRLIETGAICLIDEIFLECHYNRWQRCCPGERSSKYQQSYGQCLDLFNSLREKGVLVHQWY
ncbi:hypothetical protein MKW94_025843 [Papaver nudicaule]|uniref:Methyltransferase FkbM domain-containing protein n=1 Tax=Papaver nudicaule TaxID=74823 RepID=A0AA41VTX9_PAPNU|nr:hypothetical protein [Papaver nudicaule]